MIEIDVKASNLTQRGVSGQEFVSDQRLLPVLIVGADWIIHARGWTSRADDNYYFEHFYVRFSV